MSLQVVPGSPIIHWQRLPFEILSHIFGYVSLSDPLNGPMNVSHVCQHWSLVAQNSTFIWSSVTIQLNTVGSFKHHLASAYLKRSRNVPINLTIDATRLFESWEKTELLLQHAHRINSLRIKANDSDPDGSLATKLWKQIDMPMLNLEAFDTVVSSTSIISAHRKASVDENVNTIPPVSDDLLVSWVKWKPTGLTVLSIDSTGLWSPPDLNEIHHVLATTCHTLTKLQYKGPISGIDDPEPQVNTLPVIPLEKLHFPELRSLAVLCHDNMVPLLKLMIIPTLESLTLRDFIAYPATIPTTPAIGTMDIDDSDLTFDPDGFFQAIKQWTTISHLEIYGIDGLSDNLSQADSEFSSYLNTLSRLSSLVLFGIGAATSVAYSLFSSMHDQTGEPPLPKLSSFVVAVVEMSQFDLQLSHYLIARQRHHLPRLHNLSVNSNYVGHLRDMNCIDILYETSDNIFVISDPEIGKFNSMEGEKLFRRE